jgi:ectoine hydroxylase-related dioxygenase (phytanoyl-CoA dioxygenase family)
LWALPGSHTWSDHDAWTEAFRRIDNDAFVTDGAARVPMRAGDVLLHDIRLLHGSPPSEGGALRRVVYLEFRPVATERAVGPHDERYIERKREVLAACTENRATVPGDLRVPHDEYWRG